MICVYAFGFRAGNELCKTGGVFLFCIFLQGGISRIRRKFLEACVNICSSEWKIWAQDAGRYCDAKVQVEIRG